MGNVNAVPVVSQLKSAVVAIGGDTEGARQIQLDFANECPIVSQTKSLVEHLSGDDEAAMETQRRCGKSMFSLATSTPGIGHGIGIGAYVTGNTELGDSCMKNASRNAVVMAAGAAGFVVGGPGGAVIAGASSGALMDGTITAYDSVAHGETRLYGTLAAVQNVKQGIENGKNVSAAVFDLATIPVFDALGGKAGGHIGRGLAPRLHLPIEPGGFDYIAASKMVVKALATKIPIKTLPATPFDEESSQPPVQPSVPEQSKQPLEDEEQFLESEVIEQSLEGKEKETESEPQPELEPDHETQPLVQGPSHKELEQPVEGLDEEIGRPEPAVKSPPQAWEVSEAIREKLESNESLQRFFSGNSLKNESARRCLKVDDNDTRYVHVENDCGKLKVEFVSTNEGLQIQIADIENIKGDFYASDLILKAKDISFPLEPVKQMNFVSVVEKSTKGVLNDVLEGRLELVLKEGDDHFERIKGTRLGEIATSFMKSFRTAHTVTSIELTHDHAGNHLRFFIAKCSLDHF